MGTLQTVMANLDSQSSLPALHSNTDQRKSNALETLKRCSESVTKNAEAGVSLFDLVDSPPVSRAAFARGLAVLQANFGTEYSPEKTAVLFDMIREDEWTESRFNSTLAWFVKSKKFPSWTVSDWFDHDVKLYPYSWMLKQVAAGVDAKTDLEIWEVEYNVFGWKMRDGVPLPFLKREDLVGRASHSQTTAIWEARKRLRGYVKPKQSVECSTKTKEQP